MCTAYLPRFSDTHVGTTSFQLTAYDQENFQGKKMEFTSACPTVTECGFENLRSLKVECGA